MKQIILVFAVLTLIVTGLFSQELSDTDNNITAISVTGLKKTKPRVLDTPLQKFIGMDAEDIDINEVYAIVQGTGVLEPLSIEIIENQEKNGKTIAITVREKWSIFPMPIARVSSDGWAVGAGFADTNAFGRKDTMMIVGLYGPENWMASVGYFGTPDGIGGFGLHILGSFSLQEKETKDQKGEQTLRRYNSLSISPTVGLSYRLNEFITPGLGLSYQYVDIRDSDNQISAPENGIQGITFSPSIRIRNATWDGFFLNEKQASLKYNYTLVIDNDDVHSVSLNASFNHSIIPGLKVYANTGAVFATSSAAPFFESSPMNAAVNILPQNYSAINIAGISLGLEKYLLKFRFGTVSILAAYQAVYSDGESLSNQFDHGIVSMLQMYFSRIAIPGVGLGGAYNIDKNKWQFSFNLGMLF